MTDIFLNFTIQSETSYMSVSVTSYTKIINWAFPFDKPKKRGEVYIFDSHFVFRSFEGECRSHFDFFLICLSVMLIFGPLSYFK